MAAPCLRSPNLFGRFDRSALELIVWNETPNFISRRMTNNRAPGGVRNSQDCLGGHRFPFGQFPSDIVIGKVKRVFEIAAGLKLPICKMGLADSGPPLPISDVSFGLMAYVTVALIERELDPGLDGTMPRTIGL
jgi:hypothetical protein